MVNKNGSRYSISSICSILNNHKNKAHEFRITLYTNWKCELQPNETTIKLIWQWLKFKFRIIYRIFHFKNITSLCLDLMEHSVYFKIISKCVLSLPTTFILNFYSLLWKSRRYGILESNLITLYIIEYTKEYFTRHRTLLKMKSMGTGHLPARSYVLMNSYLSTEYQISVNHKSFTFTISASVIW